MPSWVSDGQPDDSTGGSEPNVPASNIGIEVAAAFAASPYESTPHLVIEMKVPLILALNMSDMAKKQGFIFEDDKIATFFGAPVVHTIGSKGNNFC